MDKEAPQAQAEKEPELSDFSEADIDAVSGVLEKDSLDEAVLKRKAVEVRLKELRS